MRRVLLAQCDINIDDLNTPDSPVDIFVEAEWLDRDEIEIQVKTLMLTRWGKKETQGKSHRKR
jgi:hypothetical protein